MESLFLFGISNSLFFSKVYNITKERKVERAMDKTIVPECERRHIFLVMMFIGGFYGAYTYTVRGGVFCNAQTANLVLMSIALSQGLWMKAAYYLIPLTAYFSGSVLSEALPHWLDKSQVRWETILVGFEILAVILLGAVPDSWPFQITQVAINFIAALQYATFRMARGIPMATVFCTNHIRQLGIHFVKWCHDGHSSKEAQYLTITISMILSFIAGAITASFLGHYFSGKALWFTLIPLALVFIDLFHADLLESKQKKLAYLSH